MSTSRHAVAGRVLRRLALPALAAVTLALLPAPAGGDEQANGDRTAARALAEQLEMRPRHGAANVQRLLSQPAASFDLPARWRPFVGDRAAARRETLELRASRRAYDGAPPVMPHSRNFVRTKTCLDCHAEGIWLGRRFGPPMSHPELRNCLQCHVESRNLDLSADGAEVTNTFAGARAPTGGRRVWAGAPPVMPHGTMMRNDCLSCHGPESYPGLRTDHPERTNCVQCHAVAAALDQTSPFFTGNPTLVVPAPGEPAPVSGGDETPVGP